MAYCEYNHSDTVGFCVGGPDEPATNADGTRPTSIAQCWAACTTSYGSELKAIDFWPNLANTDQRRGSCFCQTACTGIIDVYCDLIGPCHLAILPSAIPGWSNTTCPEASALPISAGSGVSPVTYIIRVALPVAGIAALVYLVYYLKKQKKLCFKPKQPKADTI